MSELLTFPPFQVWLGMTALVLAVLIVGALVRWMLTPRDRNDPGNDFW